MYGSEDCFHVFDTPEVMLVVDFNTEWRKTTVSRRATRGHFATERIKNRLTGKGDGIVYVLPEFRRFSERVRVDATVRGEVVWFP